LVVTGSLVILWYHFTHRLASALIEWGWRHYVGVWLEYAPIVLFAAFLLWLPLRRFRWREWQR
jgi:hypothetical protein